MSHFTIKQISSLEKVFPAEPYIGPEFSSFTVLKGEEFSYQVLYTKDAELKNTAAVHIDSPLSSFITLREVVYIPSEMPAYPEHDAYYITDKAGLFPDLLAPLQSNSIEIVARHNRTLWVSVKIPETFASGIYPIRICFVDEASHLDTSVTFYLRVLDAVLPPQRLIVTQWFHSDCIASYYGVDVFSDRYWTLVEHFIKTAAKNGCNMILTPIFTPPLDTEVGGERPTVQLIDIEKEGDTYRFTFDRLKQWIEMCHRCGIQYFEMAHLFTQWGAGYTPKIVARQNGELTRIFGWDVKADSTEYRNFLRQMLPALTGFLKREGVAQDTCFHISDEPTKEHMESYRAARGMVVDLLKGFKLTDALSDYDFYKSGLVSHPIVGNNHVEPFIENNVRPLWVYYCCAQNTDVSNRFFAMPSYRNRIIGTQFFKYDVEGFLQWGYNFYYTNLSRRLIDPYHTTDCDCAFPSGDAFSVYPGPDGAYESLRLKVFHDALQDLRAMQLLSSLAGKDNVLKLIEHEAGMPIDWKHYPHSADFILNLRSKINLQIESHYMQK